MRKILIITICLALTCAALTYSQMKPEEDLMPLKSFLNRYCSWVKLPGPAPIDKSAIAPDITAFWSNGKEYQSREEFVSAHEEAIRELQEYFTTFCVTPLNVTYRRNGNVGWIVYYLDEEGTMKENCEQFTKAIKSTLILEKREGQWQLVHEHSSQIKKHGKQ